MNTYNGKDCDIKKKLSLLKKGKNKYKYIKSFMEF